MANAVDIPPENVMLGMFFLGGRHRFSQELFGCLCFAFGTDHVDMNQQVVLEKHSSRFRILSTFLSFSFGTCFFMSPGVGEIPKKEIDIYAISKNKHVGLGFSLKMETFVGWEVRGIKCDN